MSKVRNCEGCDFLNKKRKTNPCNRDLPAVYDATNNLYIRPNSCKEKVRKVDPKKELKKLKEQVIDLFQTYIKYRDNWTCVVCGLKVDCNNNEQRKLMHAGHVISRSIKQLLLDEKNCHAQCRTCNLIQDKKGISPKYLSFLVDKYGGDIFNYYCEKIKNNEDIDWKKEKEKWELKLDEIKKM